MRARPTLLLSGAAALLLAACEPPVPEAASVVRGPGFETPAQAAARERAREQALRGPMPAPEPAILPPPVPAPATPGQLITEGNAIEPPMTEASPIGDVLASAAARSHPIAVSASPSAPEARAIAEALNVFGLRSKLPAA